MRSTPLTLLASAVALPLVAAQTLRGDGFALLYPTARDLADESGRTGYCAPRNTTSGTRIPVPLSGTFPLVLRAGDNSSKADVSATISWGDDPTPYGPYEGILRNGTEVDNELFDDLDGQGKGLYDCYETNVQSLLLDVEGGNVTEGALGTLIVYYDESDGPTWTQCSDVVLVSNYTPPAQYRECPGTSAAHRAASASGNGAAIATLLALSALWLGHF
ncbi:uncharacterized protein RHOBADRAFT_55743 [Rhodotorula graminis WP1]|uniref:Uncharacterized protein n=1 Tax=Rhodotorula graminis (strain WP1) TaxID=578459 RepID=A0A0N8PZL4_RHOGW|nr:uncharacterized protein RHOBADRAFT_55743 [Rhodotorula graminis WP1]KPV72653.1 hypothetical protein RHOBADRAFT_55743 [Rhodotorula graminis WP1]